MRGCVMGRLLMSSRCVIGRSDLDSWRRNSCLLRRDSSRRLLEPGAKLDTRPTDLSNRRGAERDKDVVAQAFMPELCWPFEIRARKTQARKPALQAAFQFQGESQTAHVFLV